VVFLLIAFPQNPVWSLLLSYTCYMCCPFHPPWLGHCTWWRVRVIKLLSPSSLPSLHLSSVQIFSSAPFSQTLSLCSSLNVREQVSHPCISKFFIFCTVDEKTEGSGSNGSKHCPDWICSQFPPGSNFDLLWSFPSIWAVSHFQRIS
jgi:hypothetical protein